MLQMFGKKIVTPEERHLFDKSEILSLEMFEGSCGQRWVLACTMRKVLAGIFGKFLKY